MVLRLVVSSGFIVILFSLESLASHVKTGENGLFRLRCYNHTSNRGISRNYDCENKSCTIVVEFCISRNNYWSSCRPEKEKRYRFEYTNILGSCAPNKRKNVPDTSFNVTLNSSEPFLQIRITYSTKKNILETEGIIDSLSYNLTNFNNFPGSPYDSPMTEYATVLKPSSRQSKAASWAPLLVVETALQCQPYRSGIGCRQKCETSNITECLMNGTSICLTGNCSFSQTTLTAITFQSDPSITNDSTLHNIFSKIYVRIAVVAGLAVVILIVSIVFACIIRGRKSNRKLPKPEEPIPLWQLGRLANDGRVQPCNVACNNEDVTRVDLTPYDRDPTYESMYEEIGETYYNGQDEYLQCHYSDSEGCSNNPRDRLSNVYVGPDLPCRV